MMRNSTLSPLFCWLFDSSRSTKEGVNDWVGVSQIVADVKMSFHLWNDLREKAPCEASYRCLKARATAISLSTLVRIVGSMKKPC
jgi:hypothetical protein